MGGDKNVHVCFISITVFGSIFLLSLNDSNCPGSSFWKKFRKLDLNQRFMAYFTIGNFYMINIVFLLELLHISNRFTLIIFTVIPALVVFSKSRNISIKLKITNAWKTFNRLISGQLGIKTALNKFGRYVLKLFKKLLVKIKEIFVLILQTG